MVPMRAPGATRKLGARSPMFLEGLSSLNRWRHTACPALRRPQGPKGALPTVLQVPGVRSGRPCGRAGPGPWCTWLRWLLVLRLVALVPDGATGRTHLLLQQRVQDHLLEPGLWVQNGLCGSEGSLGCVAKLAAQVPCHSSPPATHKSSGPTLSLGSPSGPTPGVQSWRRLGCEARKGSGPETSV